MKKEHLREIDKLVEWYFENRPDNLDSKIPVNLSAQEMAKIFKQSVDNPNHFHYKGRILVAKGR